MNDLFERYLTKKKEKNERINVYLKASQNIPDRYGKDSKINNIMLSGRVAEVDSNTLLLKEQECLIPFNSILSIKPDKI